MNKSFTIINPWLEALTAGDGISADDLKDRIISVVLRDENNLLILNWNNELYVDLQLEDWITPNDTLPVGVTTGRVLQADWWIATWTMLCFKTTSWDYVCWIYGDDGKLYVDNGTGTFKQIYLKSEVDALLQEKQDQHIPITVSLTVAGWSNNTQTVTATGVTANSTVIVSPTPASMWDYSDAKIYCSAQWADSLTFTCTGVPANAVDVNIVVLN